MAPRACVKLDSSVISSGFLDSFDYVLTDCDGVLWSGNDAYPGAAETIRSLTNLGKHVIYVTNNSTKSLEDYVEKCHKLGFPATDKDIISTSYCAASYLKSMGFQKKVYVFGTSGITQELDKVNIEYLPIGPDPIPDDQWIQWMLQLKLDPEVGAVVVGFDHHVSYPKLAKAASYLKNPETLFIGTNKDEQFPTDTGLSMPGTGAFVCSVELISGRNAVILGKPEKYMLDCVKLNYPDIDFKRTIMIGDRLSTDILLGTRYGIRTLFVLTGINSLEDAQEHQNSSDKERHLLVPDYYLPALADLLPLIQS